MCIRDRYQAGTDTLLASGDVYTLQPSDVGRNIYVVLKFTDDKGTDEAVASVEAGPVSPFTFQTFAEEGFEFSEAWPGTQADSSPTPAFAAPVAETFDYAEAWPGTQVDASPEPAFASLFEAGFETVEGWPGLNSAPEGTLSISGSGFTGSAHSVVNNVTDADGVDADTITYRWYREDGTLRRTSSTFTPSTSDAGYNFYVVLTYTDNNGTEEQVTSGLFPNTAEGLILAAVLPTLTLNSVTQDGTNAIFNITVDNDGGGEGGYVDSVYVFLADPWNSTHRQTGLNLSTGDTAILTIPISDLGIYPSDNVYEITVEGTNPKYTGAGSRTSNSVTYTHNVALDAANTVTAFSPFADFPPYFHENYSERNWPGTPPGDDLGGTYQDYWSFVHTNQAASTSYWIGGAEGFAGTPYPSQTEMAPYLRSWTASFPFDHTGGVVRSNHYLKTAALDGAFDSPTTSLSLRCLVGLDVNFFLGPSSRHWAGVTAFAGDSTTQLFTGYTAAFEKIRIPNNGGGYKAITLRGGVPLSTSATTTSRSTDRSLLFGGLLGAFIIPTNKNNFYIRLDAVRSGSYTYFNVYYSLDNQDAFDPTTLTWGSPVIAHRVLTSSLPSNGRFGTTVGHHSVRATGNLSSDSDSADEQYGTAQLDNFHAMVE